MPIGEILGECRREVRHTELLEDVDGAGALFRLESTGEQPGGEVGGDGLGRANAELQVLHDREAVDELKVLEGACKPHAGPRMRWQVGYVFAGQQDATGIGAIKAADAVDERGLARSIRTDESMHRAAVD